MTSQQPSQSQDFDTTITATVPVAVLAPAELSEHVTHHLERLDLSDVLVIHSVSKVKDLSANTVLICTADAKPSDLTLAEYEDQRGWLTGLHAVITQRYMAGLKTVLVGAPFYAMFNGPKKEEASPGGRHAHAQNEDEFWGLGDKNSQKPGESGAVDLLTWNEWDAHLAVSDGILEVRDFFFEPALPTEEHHRVLRQLEGKIVAYKYGCIIGVTDIKYVIPSYCVIGSDDS
jgi:hypothetical protein